MKNPTKIALLIIIFLIPVSIWWVFQTADGHKPTTADSKPAARSTQHETQAGQDGGSTETKQPSQTEEVDYPPVANAVAGESRGKPLPWSRDTPSAAPIVPAGVKLSAARARVTLGKRVVSPALHATHFEKTALKAKQQVKVRIDWPKEHQTEQIMLHCVHGGTVNGKNGDVVAVTEKGGARYIEFNFTAGPDTGLYQVGLRAANVEYELPFWVNTGVARVDPPAH